MTKDYLKFGESLIQDALLSHIEKQKTCYKRIMAMSLGNNSPAMKHAINHYLLDIHRAEILLGIHNNLFQLKTIEAHYKESLQELNDTSDDDESKQTYEHLINWG